MDREFPGAGDARAAVDDGVEALSGSRPVSLELYRERHRLAPAVARELAGHARILELAAAALPVVEPDPAVIGAVIDEAERAIARRRDSGRARVIALPGLALLASAAAVLLWLVPEGPPLAPATLEEEPAGVEARVADAGDLPAEPIGAREATDGRARSGEVEETARAEGRPLDASDPPADADPSRVHARDAGRRRAAPDRSRARPPKKRSPRTSPATAPPQPRAEQEEAGEEAPRPRDKDALRERLARADRLREAGDCDRAESEYRSVVDGGGLEGAFALIGLGLCAEIAGDARAARSYFAAAGRAGPVDDRHISARRARQRGRR